MLLSTSTYHDMDMIVNLLEDNGLFTPEQVAEYDKHDFTSTLKIAEKDVETVAKLLVANLGSAKYPYSGYCVEKE